LEDFATFFDSILTVVFTAPLVDFEAGASLLVALT
jgi:hypothetical protein